MGSNNKQCLECLECARAHIDDICKKVNDDFTAKKVNIRTWLVGKIVDSLVPVSAHYELRLDAGSCDFSGRLVATGKIKLSQTVEHFLGEEYSGQKKAAFAKKYGWKYLTYGELMSDDTIDLAENMMRERVWDYLENVLGLEFTKTQFDEVYDRIHDKVCDNCVAGAFFDASKVAGFAGIASMPLQDILAEYNAANVPLYPLAEEKNA